MRTGRRWHRNRHGVNVLHRKIPQWKEHERNVYEKMVKIWKRSLSMLLAVMMIFSMMPMQAIAAELEETGTDDTSIVEPETPEEEPEVPEEEPEEPEEPEHTCEFSAVVTDPTCTDGGYTTYTCTCGETYTADEVEALDHAFEEGEVGRRMATRRG